MFLLLLPTSSKHVTVFLLAKLPGVAQGKRHALQEFMTLQYPVTMVIKVMDKRKQINIQLQTVLQVDLVI